GSTRVQVAWAGDHLLYESTVGGVPTISSVAADQRERHDVLPNATDPAATSDGRIVVFESVAPGDRGGVWTADADGRHRIRLVVCDLPGCLSRRMLNVQSVLGKRLRWTPDRLAIAYVDAATQMNLWAQPLDGSPPHQLTHFTDRIVEDFAWSRDGRRLAISR